MLVPQNFTWGIGGRVKRLYTWCVETREWLEDKVRELEVWHDRKVVMEWFNRDYNLAAFVEVFVFLVLLAGLAAIAFRYLYIA
jgi:hypothetical protein